jgi:hypothetical protein
VPGCLLEDYLLALTSVHGIPGTCASFLPSGSFCDLACAPGFSPTGSLTVSCVNGEPALPLGICMASPCLSPPSEVGHNHVSIGSCGRQLDSGDQCSVACDNNYEPSGSMSVVCFQGTFSALSGFCRPMWASCTSLPVEVGSVAHVTAGSCSSSTASGMSCMLGCADGFSGVGSMLVTCTDGFFSSLVGTCEVALASCTSLPVEVGSVAHVTAGSCSSSMASGMSCMLGCADGFSGVGSMLVTCTDGFFSSLVGTCEVALASCTSLPVEVGSVAHVTAGSCSSSTASGMSCMLGCADGFSGVGSMLVTCTDGFFSALTGSCEARGGNCVVTTFPWPENVDFSACGDTLSSGSACILDCESGYSFEGDMRVMCTDGVFSELSGSCIGDSCLYLPAESNLPGTVGSCLENLPSGDSCSLGCADGFFAIGDMHVECDAGQWSHPDGVCAVSSCQTDLLVPPPHAESSSCNDTISSGDVCVLTCLPGFSSNGELASTCFNGIFSTISGSCQARGCEVASGQHETLGSCSPFIESGQVCALACESGFDPTSTLQRSCLEGTLSRETGECMAWINPCWTLPPILFADSSTFAAGSCLVPTRNSDTCMLMCAEGYEAAGSLAIKCLGGVWDEPKGSCVAAGCGIPAVVGVGHVVEGTCQGGVASGTSCTLSCSEGFFPSGDMSVSCAVGAYSRFLGRCVGPPCLGLPSEVGHNYVTTGNCVDGQSSGTSCSLGCESGYHAEGSMLVNCIESTSTFSPLSGTCEMGDEDQRPVAVSEALRVHLFWGIKDVDMSHVETATDVGTPVFDPAFDVSSEAAQLFMLNVCERFTAESRILPADDNRCFYKNFYTYVTKHDISWPVEAGRFVSVLLDFLAYDGSKFRTDVGFLSLDESAQGQVEEPKLVWIHFQSLINLDKSSAGAVLEADYLFWQSFVQQLNDQAPAGVRTGYATAFEWVRMAVELALVHGTFYSIIISVSIVALALIFFTQNYILVIFMTLCVSITTVCLLGFFVLWGWTLGPFEALILPLVVGLAVDYNLHLAHFYSHASEATRQEKVLVAIRGIGPAVFASGFTTVGTHVCVCLCVWMCQTCLN